MIRKTVLLGVVVILADAGLALGQEQPDGQSNLVWNSTSAGALNTRRPGRLTDSAAARHNDALNRGFSRPEIAEQAEGPSLTKQIKIMAIQTLFDNLNAVLLAFNNLIRAQGGLAPFLPTPIVPNPRDSLL